MEREREREKVSMERKLGRKRKRERKCIDFLGMAGGTAAADTHVSKVSLFGISRHAYMLCRFCGITLGCHGDWRVWECKK